MNMTAEKIRRIRGNLGLLSPAWQLPQRNAVAAGSDPLVRKLGYLAIACAALMVLLFVVYKRV